MENIKFTIVSLPSEPTFSTLNLLKSYFYLNDFRFKNKPNNSVVHLTLCEGSCLENQIKEIEGLVFTEIKNSQPITSNYKRVTADIRGPVKDKCDFENAWISILFDDENLLNLSNRIDDILKKLNVSSTSEYIKKILENVENTNKNNVIANHINICNYARPEKALEAKEKIESSIKKEIVFDKIAFRYDNTGELAWILDL